MSFHMYTRTRSYLPSSKPLHSDMYDVRKEILFSLTEVAGEATLRSYLRKGVGWMLENILLVTG